MTTLNPLNTLDEKLSSAEKRLLDGFRNPADIQDYLDEIPYSTEHRNRCPLQVMRDRQAHCLDGGLFAAYVLRRLGYPPLILDMQPDPGMDDDHILALFRIDGCWGAVAQSNYTGLRYREAIHHTLRELVISYFEDFFNSRAEKTLRFYTRPINLARFDRMEWMWSEQGANCIEEYLYKVRIIPLITRKQVEYLSRVEELSFEAGQIGINPAGVFKLGPSPKANR